MNRGVKNFVKKLSPRSKSTGTNSFDFSSTWEEERKKADKARQDILKYNGLVRKLQQEGKRIVQIDGDGNCAPAALALDLGISSMALRREVVRQMLAEPNKFLGFMEVRSLKEYRKKVIEYGEPGVWFEEAQIRAAADVIGRAVIVHNPHYPHEPQLHPCAGNQKGEPIELLHNGINHYDLVRRDREDFSVDEAMVSNAPLSCFPPCMLFLTNY